MNAIVKVPHEETAPAPTAGLALYRMSTDAAAICREIVLATAKNIGGRSYVQVEGWQSIALAHGCVASSGDVVRHPDGSFSATGRIIRVDTGTVISSAEGYVGTDEETWFGGTVTDRWGKTKVLPKRPDYAIRAMAQTRSISRAARSAFAHVVVMMNAGLSTTPAEEVQPGGFDQAPEPRQQHQEPAPQAQPAAPHVQKQTVTAWLDALGRDLEAALTEAEVTAIGDREAVIKARSALRNGALARFNAMMAEAIERTAGITEDGEVTGGDGDLGPE